MRIPKARTYLRFWRVVKYVSQYNRHICAWQCSGHAAALTWIQVGFPKAESGYYRSGIQRQYCVRFRNHKGDCLSLITDHGLRTWRGVFFTPENRSKMLKERVS
jgi:hypothetical protein